MSSRHPTTPVVRLRLEQTGEDRYGDPVWEDVSTDLPPALFAPGGVEEPVEPGRAPVVSEPTLYWRNAWPDVIASDRLTVRGKTYSVEGEPADWRGARVGGLVVRLKLVEEGTA